MKHLAKKILTTSILSSAFLASTVMANTFTLTNKTDAFISYAGFTANGDHTVSNNCASYKTCSLSIPDDVTTLELTFGVTGGTFVRTITSMNGFSYKTITCDYSRSWIGSITGANCTIA